MAPHSSTLAWKIPWTESLVGCSPWGREELDTTELLHFDFSLSCIGEGNGNPLQCSCLKNPRDGGAWLAAVYGVAQSWARLKRLSSSICIEYISSSPGGTNSKQCGDAEGAGQRIPKLHLFPSGFLLPTLKLKCEEENISLSLHIFISYQHGAELAHSTYNSCSCFLTSLVGVAECLFNKVPQTA